MTECIDTGRLRLYMEGPSAMPDAERAAIAAHLATCAECRAELDSLRVLEAKVMAQLSVLAPTQAPDIQAALMKMRGKMHRPEVQQLPAMQPAGGEPPFAGDKLPAQDKRSNSMHAITSMKQGQRLAIFSTLAAALVLFSFISIPTLRAAADSLLQTFRVKSVVFVPVDADRLTQLSSLLSDPTSLFISQPSIVGSPKSTQVASLKDASQLVGFTPEQPSAFPSDPTSTQFTVQDNMKVQAQVNIDRVRDLLAAAGVNDVTLPDTLGSEPITAEVPAFLESTYAGDGYKFTLVHGKSPNVTLPAGVDLSQLGKAGLELLGMQPDQAGKMSKQIDWSSTLVVPFPANLSDVLQVQIGDSQGMLVGTQGTTRTIEGAGNMTVVYWQKGDQFYVLAGQGPEISNDILLLAARSVK